MNDSLLYANQKKFLPFWNSTSHLLFSFVSNRIRERRCWSINFLLDSSSVIMFLRACLQGRVGEVARFGGFTHLSINSLILIWLRLHDRWGDLPHVTSPSWGPPPPCKQAIILCITKWGKRQSLYITSGVKVKTRAKQDKGGLVSINQVWQVTETATWIIIDYKWPLYFTLNYNRIKYSNTWEALCSY